MEIVLGCVLGVGCTAGWGVGLGGAGRGVRWGSGDRGGYEEGA